MTKYLMREPWGCQPEPRTHAGEVEGTNGGTSQRYLSLTTLKAPQNLPQHGRVHGPVNSVRLYCRSHRQRQARRGSHVSPYVRHLLAFERLCLNYA